MKEDKFEYGETTINNHFVPEIYLSYFYGNTGKLICYDKIKNSYWETNTTRIGFEKHLYTTVSKGQKKSFEKHYTKNVDNLYKDTIEKIEKYSNCILDKKVLDKEDIKSSLNNIIVNQLLRTPETIYMRFEQYKQGMENLKKAITNIEKIKGEFEEYIKVLNEYINEFVYKDYVLSHTTDDSTIKRFEDILSQKSWILFKNVSSIPFITSDNPLIRYNYRTGIHNDGIARNDVFIGFPVTKKYYLAIVPNHYILGGAKIVSGTCYTIGNESIETIRLWNSFQKESCRRAIYFPFD